MSRSDVPLCSSATMRPAERLLPAATLQSLTKTPISMSVNCMIEEPVFLSCKDSNKYEPTRFFFEFRSSVHKHVLNKMCNMIFQKDKPQVKMVTLYLQ